MYHSPKKPGPSEILRSLSRYGLEPKGVGFHSEPFANFLKGYIPAWIKPIQFRNVPCQAGSTGRKWKARKEARKWGAAVGPLARRDASTGFHGKENRGKSCVSKNLSHAICRWPIQFFRWIRSHSIGIVPMEWELFFTGYSICFSYLAGLIKLPVSGGSNKQPMYGNFEGFPPWCILWVGDIVVPALCYDDDLYSPAGIFCRLKHRQSHWKHWDTVDGSEIRQSLVDMENLPLCTGF